MSKSKIEIIDETVEFYTKNPRAIDEFGRCFYLTSVGVQCAHSRCLTAEGLTFAKTLNYGSAINVIEGYSIANNCNGDDIHKPEYRGHTSDFWVAIQVIHDLPNHWNGNIFTEEGKKYVNDLKFRINERKC